jgi:hypothetical protein
VWCGLLTHECNIYLHTLTHTHTLSLSHTRSVADVLQQYESGVDTVISDHVGHVNKGLARASQEQAAYLY